MDIQKELQAFSDQGYSRLKIAELLGKSRRWVNKRLHEYGIKTHAKPGRARNNFPISYKCVICGVNVKKGAMKYCSSACCAKGKWDIKKTVIEQSGRVEHQRQGRRYLLERDGHQCAICHNTEWNGQNIPLVLDHIDGNPDNWDLNNLRMICCNCDALTPTYKNKNRGNGRHSRRQRYKEGKSF